jgi:hypothetical protein
MARSWLERRVKAAVRRAGLTLFAVLLVLAALAAVVGGSILLAARIGAANAAFVVAGALLGLSAFLLGANEQKKD